MSTQTIEGEHYASDYISGTRPMSDLLSLCVRSQESAETLLDRFLTAWGRLSQTQKTRVANLATAMLAAPGPLGGAIGARLFALTLLADADLPPDADRYLPELALSKLKHTCEPWAVMAHFAECFKTLANMIPQTAPPLPSKSRYQTDHVLAPTPITEPVFARERASVPALPEKLRQGVAKDREIPDSARGFLIHLRSVGRAPRLDNEGELDVPQYAWESNEYALLRKHKQAIIELLQEEATNPSFRLEPIKTGRDVTEPGRRRVATSTSLPVVTTKGSGLASRIMDHLKKHKGKEVAVQTLRAMVDSPSAVAQGKEQAWLSSCIASLVRKGHPITVIWDGERHSGYVLEGD